MSLMDVSRVMLFLYTKQIFCLRVPRVFFFLVVGHVFVDVFWAPIFNFGAEIHLHRRIWDQAIVDQEWSQGCEHVWPHQHSFGRQRSHRCTGKHLFFSVLRKNFFQCLRKIQMVLVLLWVALLSLSFWLQGLKCIEDSVAQELELPELPRLSRALEGARICITGLEEERVIHSPLLLTLQDGLIRRFQLLCGEYVSTFSKETTHLIADKPGSAKYLVFFNYPFLTARPRLASRSPLLPKSGLKNVFKKTHLSQKSLFFFQYFQGWKYLSAEFCFNADSYLKMLLKKMEEPILLHSTRLVLTLSHT